ncbi:hypothetical protein [Flavobacterium sp.]|uniref:hypothetical protein n=1 Tax=Flavobacterium sp. TaxID=239 RepID=UPI0025BD5B9C|nr:hypothetical protein [Flavobacterium sp.]
MKTIKYSFFILFLPMILFSQNEDYLIENGQYYFTKTLNNSVAQEKLNDKSISTDFEIKKKHIVRVVSFDSHTVSYRYLTFNDDDLKKIYNNDDQIFEMSIEDFSYYTNKYINRFRNWKVGAYTVPIRIRSKDNNFEFESNLSLGANITKGVNFSRYGDHGYADFSFGISLTKVNLNENNSDLKNVNPELNTLAQSALTTSLGLTIHLDKNVNFGIFYGWDFLEGSDQEKLKWIHNKKPWLGFGINVSFNANDSSNTSEKTNQ